MPLFVKIILYVVIVAVVSVGAGYAAWACATDVLAFGRSSDTIQVTVPENASLDAIADMLHENGLIQYPWLFKLYCKFTHSAGRMDAGTYELAYNYDYHALVSGMTESGGTRTTVRVMLPEGATCAQIFALLEKNEVCTAEKLQESAANTHFDYWFLEDIPYGETNRLEGFLFPDTYDFYVNDDPDRVLEKLLSNFNRKFSDDASAQLETLNTALAERWTAKGYDESYIEAHRMTIYDLVTVASMIEKETASAKESSTIASVIYNRLCDPANYPYLNVDATIVYALGGVDGALTYEDTQIDSPYNTYNRNGSARRTDLHPGLSSISAALNSADTSYYYYALDDSTGPASLLRDVRCASGLPFGAEQWVSRSCSRPPETWSGCACRPLWCGRRLSRRNELRHALLCGEFLPGGAAEAVAFAHAHGVRVHVTVNTMPRGDELPALPAHLAPAERQRRRRPDHRGPWCVPHGAARGAELRAARLYTGQHRKCRLRGRVA